MTTASDFIEGTLDDYLVSLAEGIQEAQLQLNQLEVTGPTGQPTICYHLPRVDFELRLTMQMGKEPATGSTGTQGITRTAAGATIPRLVFRPVQAGTSSETHSEAVSIIKGSFVAVPVNGGQPPPVIRCSLARGATAAETLVTVTIRNSLGEPLPDVDVQFNIDPDLSAQMSGLTGVPADPATVVVYGVRTTDANGQVQNVLRIGKESTKAIIALVIDALGRSEVVIAGGGAK